MTWQPQAGLSIVGWKAGFSSRFHRMPDAQRRSVMTLQERRQVSGN
jgi:hypothetical protein